MPPKAKETPPPKEGKKDDKGEDEKTKMAPPDKTQYNKDIAQKNSEIEKLTKEKGAVDRKLQEKSTDKDGYYEKKAVLAAKMKTYGDQIKRLNEQRVELRTGLKGKKDQQNKVTQLLKETSNSITFKSEAALEARIAEIQFEMCTGTYTLAEEKRKVQEIQNLKKQKPRINAQQEKLVGLEGKAEELKTSPVFEDLKGQITEVSTKIDQVWKQKEDVKQEYVELIEAHKKETETSNLEAERKEIQTKIGELVRERNELRKKMQDEEQAYRKYEAEQRKIQQEKRAAEANKRREEYEQKDLARKQDQLMVQPHLAEIALLEQTITFCKNLLPKEQEVAQENIKPTFNNPEGSVVLIKKQDRDEEFYMPASKKKGPHKKNKAPSSNVIKHDAYTFRLFDALKISAPSSTDQIPATLEQLQNELERYNELVATWEQKRDDGTLLKEFQEKAKKKQDENAQKAAQTQDDVAATEEA